MVLCQCPYAVSMAPEHAGISSCHGSACMCAHRALKLVDVRLLGLFMAIAFLKGRDVDRGDGIESDIVISVYRSCVLA